MCPKHYRAPFQYFASAEPGMGTQPLVPEIIQQIDIMPTVLSQLHDDKPYVAFGRDSFDPATKPVAFNFLDDTYQFFSGSYLLQFDGIKSVGLYDVKKDRVVIKNLIDQLPDTVQAMEIELKAFVQQYKNRMVDDNLTMEGSLVSVRK